ncbi:MAG TPA: response regulator [Desulfonatronum sp.]|nr:response regulator [Desulfonatronum sp.]
MENNKNLLGNSRRTIEQAVEEIHRLGSELNRARAEAAQVSKIKDDFLSRISHELRTPLNAIMGIGELLWETGLDETQANYFSMIRESTSQLIRLVDEILDFSEMHDDAASRIPEVFSFRDTFEPAFVQFRLKAQEKGLYLFVHVDPDLPELVRGVPRWIFQIISALVDNAVKFTDHGDVLLRLYPLDFQDNAFTLCLCVTDTGIGVPKEEQQRIFQKFTTVHDSAKYSGIGMGLALAEKLVSRLGGRIWVDSELYLGSTFYVSLPMEMAAKSHAHSAETVAGRTLRILLAEDEPVNQFTTVELLKKEGHFIKAVENGRLALEALSRDSFDLVLMDISMPEMDGLEAAQAIRSGQISHVDPDIPIIALTAMVMPADSQRCMAAGMNAHVSKPVETRKLQEIMDQVLSRRQ